jgi:hypothetical protein
MNRTDGFLALPLCMTVLLGSCICALADAAKRHHQITETPIPVGHDQVMAGVGAAGARVRAPLIGAPHIAPHTFRAHGGNLVVLGGPSSLSRNAAISGSSTTSAHNTVAIGGSFTRQRR